MDIILRHRSNGLLITARRKMWAIGRSRGVFGSLILETYLEAKVMAIIAEYLLF